MSDTPQFLSERLLSEGEKSIAFFLGLSPQEYEQVIYTDGTQWTTQQVLAHYVAAEASLYRLLENITSGGSGSPEDFNLDAYNERKVAELTSAPIDRLISMFQENRKRTAAFVARLSPSDLERRGRHPWLGIASLSEIIKIIYRHNQIHQREMRNCFSQKL